MKEIAQILEAYKKIDFAAQKAALATVVHVEGSSYRRPGARMLITDDGRLTGAISGGCLEGDALRKALLAMHNEKAMVVTYDTTDDDDAKVGIGLGCNGIIHILIEPILSSDPNNPIQLLLKARSTRQKAALVTLFSITDKRSSPPGTKFLLSESEEVNTIENDSFSEAIHLQADEALRSNTSVFKFFEEQQWHAFIEVLAPTTRLVVFGAGNDVMPLVEMTAIMGWESMVIDGRATHAKPERFPLANQVTVAKPANALAFLEPDNETYYLLMTHNYNYDLEVFKGLLERKVKYIGVLGPKKKLDRMLEESSNNPDLPNVFGPVGLDIGAEAAEEIALSIIAEIKAVATSRDGRSLREKPLPIHTPIVQYSSVIL